MTDFLFVLTLAPVLRGLFAMTLAGVSFPIAGVMVLRMGLVPMRYMLMHGVMLGGAIAMALSIPSFPIIAVVNIILVLCMVRMTGKRAMDMGMASAALMVFTMGLASLLMHVADIPAKDTLELMWGSPFALQRMDLVVIALLTVLIIIYTWVNGRKISAMFFDPEIASSLGVDVQLHRTIMVVLIALVVAVAMKLLGALLIDALLILPVIIVSRTAVSLRQMFVRSSICGALLSVLGYLLSVWLDIPASGTISILAVLAYAGTIILQTIRTRMRSSSCQSVSVSQS